MSGGTTQSFRRKFDFLRKRDSGLEKASDGVRRFLFFCFVKMTRRDTDCGVGYIQEDIVFDVPENNCRRLGWWEWFRERVCCYDFFPTATHACVCAHARE